MKVLEHDLYDVSGAQIRKHDLPAGGSHGVIIYVACTREEKEQLVAMLRRMEEGAEPEEAPDGRIVPEETFNLARRSKDYRNVILFEDDRDAARRSRDMYGADLVGVRRFDGSIRILTDRYDVTSERLRSDYQPEGVPVARAEAPFFGEGFTEALDDYAPEDAELVGIGETAPKYEKGDRVYLKGIGYGVVRECSKKIGQSYRYRVEMKSGDPGAINSVIEVREEDLLRKSIKDKRMSTRPMKPATKRRA